MGELGDLVSRANSNLLLWRRRSNLGEVEYFKPIDGYMGAMQAKVIYPLLLQGKIRGGKAVFSDLVPFRSNSWLEPLDFSV